MSNAPSQCWLTIGESTVGIFFRIHLHLWSVARSYSRASNRAVIELYGGVAICKWTRFTGSDVRYPATVEAVSPASGALKGQSVAATAVELEWLQLALVLAESACYRANEFLGVKTDPVLEHDLNVLNIGDVLRRITLHHHEVGVLADFD